MKSFLCAAAEAFTNNAEEQLHYMVLGYSI